MTEPNDDTLDDGGEEWGYGDDAPEHANLAAAIGVLRPEAQGRPDWLRHAGQLDGSASGMCRDRHRERFADRRPGDGDALSRGPLSRRG